MLRDYYEWGDDELTLLKNNYGSISVREITKMLPKRAYGGVRNMIRKLKLNKNNNLRKYYVNKECFKEYSYNSCYWAGFIAADGCVTDFGRLSISLKKDDIEHIDKFHYFTNYSNKTKIYKNICSVSISCKEICKDLNDNFNITPRKSKTLLPPIKITDEDMVACFIKGVIDGDGSVMDDSIVIYGTKPLLVWVKKYFDKWTPSTNYKKAEVRQIQKHLYAYKISTTRRNYIHNKLKTLKCDELTRKWN